MAVKGEGCSVSRYGISRQTVDLFCLDLKMCEREGIKGRQKQNEVRRK